MVNHLDFWFLWLVLIGVVGWVVSIYATVVREWWQRQQQEREDLRLDAEREAALDEVVRSAMQRRFGAEGDNRA